MTSARIAESLTSHPAVAMSALALESGCAGGDATDACGHHRVEGGGI